MRINNIWVLVVTFLYVSPIILAWYALEEMNRTKKATGIKIHKINETLRAIDRKLDEMKVSDQKYFEIMLRKLVAHTGTERLEHHTGYPV